MRIAYHISNNYNHLFNKDKEVEVLGCRTRRSGEVYGYLVRKHNDLSRLPYADMDVNDFTAYISLEELNSIPESERLWLKKTDIRFLEKNSNLKYVLQKVDDE